MNTYKKLAILLILTTVSSLNAGGFIGANIPFTIVDYELESLEKKSDVYYYGKKKSSSANLGLEIFGGYGVTDGFTIQGGIKYAEVATLSAQLRYGYNFFNNDIHPFVMVGTGVPLFHTYTVDRYALPRNKTANTNDFETSMLVKVGLGTSYMLNKNYIVKVGLNYTFPYSLKVEKNDLTNTPSNLFVNQEIEFYVGINFDFSGVPSYAEEGRINQEIENRRLAKENARKEAQLKRDQKIENDRWEKEHDLDY